MSAADAGREEIARGPERETFDVYNTKMNVRAEKWIKIQHLETSRRREKKMSQRARLALLKYKSVSASRTDPVAKGAFRHTHTRFAYSNKCNRAHLYTANNKYIIRLLLFGWRAEQVITISFLEFNSLFCNLLGHIFQSALL